MRLSRVVGPVVKESFAAIKTSGLYQFIAEMQKFFYHALTQGWRTADRARTKEKRLRRNAA
jgi:hypothetical protein